MRLPSLPGFVPTAPGTRQAVLPAANPAGRGTVTGVQESTEDPKDRLRSDFAHELETRLTGWVGRPGTERFDRLQEFVGPYLKPNSVKEGESADTIDLDKLPLSARRDLVKLQHASEGIEAIFVKKLLGQMRSVNFDKESPGPMAGFAKDMMDQAVAEQAAKGSSSIGIARMVFLDTAQTLVRSAIAKQHDNDQNKQSK